MLKRYILALLGERLDLCKRHTAALATRLSMDWVVGCVAPLGLSRIREDAAYPFLPLDSNSSLATVLYYPVLILLSRSAPLGTGILGMIHPTTS